MNFTNEIGLIKITVETILVNSDIKVYNVTVLKRTSVWDSMANDFIDTGAAATRETVVVKGARVGIILNNEVVDSFVDLFSGHSRFNHTMT